MLGEGDEVAVRLTVRGTHQAVFNGIPPTGRRIAVEHIHIARIVDGKGVDHWAAMDTLGMLQQLGAIPAGPPAAR
jgi:predicted ester cyclase